MDEQEKAAGEIPLCLIGEFTDINVGRVPSPKHRVILQRGAMWLDGPTVCSLDMVRLRLRFRGSDGEKLDAKAPTWQSDEYACYTARGKIGGWRFLHVFGFGPTSVSLGIGHIKQSKTDMFRGFVEFNPNKLSINDGFLRLLERLSVYVDSAEVSRFDLAADVECDRQLVRVKKDRRAYQLYQAKSLTEYLGRRNAAGFVKVYDKQAESGLYEALTRVELTCDGKWTVDEIAARWPVVYRVASADGLRGDTKALVLLMAERVANGETVEDILAMLDYRTRDKIRDMLGSECVIPFPAMGAEGVKSDAETWARRCAGEK